MSERILILDDEVAILDLLEQYLQMEGFECVLTSTAEAALQELEQHDFAILMSDLGLPDMDGLEVVRRAHKTNSAMGIIVITGFSEVSAAVNAMRAGADDYLVKPMDFNQISVSVAKAMEKRALILENRRHQEDLEMRIAAATQDLESTNSELIRTKEYLENLLHSTIDAIITCNHAGEISFLNEGALQMLGYFQDEFVGQPVEALFANGAKEVGALRRIVRGDRPLQSYESEFCHRDGHSIPVSLSVSLVHDADGHIVSWLAIGKDITEQKRLGQELRELSIKDALTNMYNHRHFYDRLESEIERARRQQHPLSLLLIDLDQFKPYNDSHGHLAGDEVLRSMGRVIEECTREHVDLGFRYGGDEFTIILPEADENQALVIAERIRTVFKQQNFEGISVSVGVMSFQKDQSLEEFVQCADAMMYEAKRSGGNRVCMFDPEVCAKALKMTRSRVLTAEDKE